MANEPLTKLCRVCWNTRGWRKPTGEAAKLETGSYVAQHGFGHEEWLFNNEWLIDGKRYGFLQPIHKFWSSYRDSSADLLLYTAAPTGDRLFVGRIQNAYVPGEDELRYALNVFRDRGWFDQMREEVREIGGDVDALVGSEPADLLNIRFDPETVRLFEPMKLVPEDHKISGFHRYHPLDWEEYPTIPASAGPSVAGTDTDADPRRQEQMRTRAAQQSTTYDPRHVRLQNRLYEHLCDTYGSSAVHYERDYVDLAVDEHKKTTFFEIKVYSTAKSCIREALGQLLEYAHYPSDERAQEFVVVGDAPVTDEDEAYLRTLRDRYDLHLYYQRFDWELGVLGTKKY